ncbi:MAG: penicillin acylase family protein [Saprospiraceae bacterium]|nr:penicillin acylase family protein [Saprospiraceae bacterium]
MNDPHLRLTLPSIWFENHINTPTIDAYGVSVPGIPFILIGFNKKCRLGRNKCWTRCRRLVSD